MLLQVLVLINKQQYNVIGVSTSLGLSNKQLVNIICISISLGLKISNSSTSSVLLQVLYNVIRVSSRLGLCNKLVIVTSACTSLVFNNKLKVNLISASTSLGFEQ